MAEIPAIESNFPSSEPLARWLDKTADGELFLCTTTGIGFIASIQTVLRNALTAPWSSYDGGHSQRVGIDGNWGPITNAGVWALAKQRSAPQSYVDAVRSAARTKVLSLDAQKVGVWLAYYQPRGWTLAVEGVPSSRVDPSELRDATLDQIIFPAGTIPLRWAQRPSVPPNWGGYAAARPTRVPLPFAEVVLGQPGGVAPRSETAPKKSSSAWWIVLLGILAAGGKKKGR